MKSSLGFRASSLLVLSIVVAVTATDPPVLMQSGTTPSPLVQRFLSRQDEPVTSYRALRRLEAHNRRHNKHGWLEAWTTLDPENGFHYEIVGEGGSAYVRDKVLRKALEREAQAYARAETASAAIGTANYHFTEQGLDADGLVGIALEPRRDESVLIRGSIYLRSDDADLVRIEGQLAKAPSFWTRRVDIVRRYQRIDAVRVPIATESVAQLLVAGRSTFQMLYEYAAINGREVGQPQPRGPEASTLAER